MAQNDFTIANQSFPNFRSDLNSALSALATLSSGASEPTTTFANQLWMDTASDPILLKLRNNDDDAWITIGSITATTDLFTLIGSIDTGVETAGLILSGSTLAADGTDTNIDITVTPKGSGVVTTAASYTDGAGKLRAIPQSGSAKTTGYTLAVGDVGEFIEVGSGGSITIPDATFSAGDVISIFNNTSGDITITCSITTAYIAGADADEASVTLATRGVCTVLFISGTVCVIAGNVS